MTTNYDKCFCGGAITSGVMDDVWMTKRGVEYRVPEDVSVPTCERCGEHYLDDALEDEIERRVQRRSPSRSVLGN